MCLKAHSDVEWKFSRSRLYMEFIRSESSLPIPFNLIPNPIVIFQMAKKRLTKQDKREQTNGDINHTVSEIRRQSMTANGKLGNGWSQPGGNELTYKVKFCLVIFMILILIKDLYL